MLCLYYLYYLVFVVAEEAEEAAVELIVPRRWKLQHCRYRQRAVPPPNLCIKVLMNEVSEQEP